MLGKKEPSFMKGVRCCLERICPLFSQLPLSENNSSHTTLNVTYLSAMATYLPISKPRLLG